jgi:membrane protein YdbS with pleckstrin-like domain
MCRQRRQQIDKTLVLLEEGTNMSQGVAKLQSDTDDKERLLLVMFRKRTGFLFYYIFGALLSGIGVLGNVATAAGFVEQSWIRWELGLAVIISGVLIIAAAEIKRRLTLYILTTWNVRIRKGIMKRTTVRVFYDEISAVDTSMNPEEKSIGIGDLRVYSNDSKEGPTVVFADIYNPDGIREIVLRMMQTAPAPVPWAHVPRTRMVVF